MGLEDALWDANSESGWMHRVWVGVLLILAPVPVLLVAQRVHPVGGASTALVRLSICLPIVLVAEAMVLGPLGRRLPPWTLWLVLLVVVASTLLLHAAVPGLPD